jgi:hypothetical protein
VTATKSAAPNGEPGENPPAPQRILHQRMVIYVENGLKNIRCTNVVFGTF